MQINRYALLISAVLGSGGALGQDAPPTVSFLILDAPLTNWAVIDAID